MEVSQQCLLHSCKELLASAPLGGDTKLGCFDGESSTKLIASMTDEMMVGWLDEDGQRQKGYSCGRRGEGFLEETDTHKKSIFVPFSDLQIPNYSVRSNKLPHPHLPPLAAAAPPLTMARLIHRLAASIANSHPNSRSLPSLTAVSDWSTRVPRRHHLSVHLSTTRCTSSTSTGGLSRQSTQTTHDITVTHSKASNKADDTLSNMSIHIPDDESMKLVDRLLQRTSEMMDRDAANVVAFSGGVDSSLVADLVYRTFSSHTNLSYSKANNTSNSTINTGSVQAVLGISSAVPQTQITMARAVAETIGIQLVEVTTTEGSDETYIKNDGHACYVCKTHLYSTLESVANSVKRQHQEKSPEKSGGRTVILYNGTNADDTQDPTRLGLHAASNFKVLSPLDQITKDEVRQAAKHLGLPNWNAAASPCLRSRLAMGVMATSDHLKAVEKAEEFVRRVLVLDESRNVRVRMLAGGKAMVELDDRALGTSDLLAENGMEDLLISELGFQSWGVRGFKTGSVAAMPTGDKSLDSVKVNL